jgi:uncharacterized membrane protein required for colicin V production
VVAAHLYLRLAVLVHRWVADPLYARWLAFGVVFVAVYWITRLVAHFLQNLFYHLYLDFFDRVLGGTFALAKGALLVGFSLMFLTMLLPKDSHLLKGSIAAPKLVSFSRQSLGLLPPDFKKRLKDYLKDWEKPREKYQAEGFRPPEEKQPRTPAAPRRTSANWPRA